MRLVAHQPLYLPWLGLFHKIAMADTFVLFDDVQYTPKEFQNRNRIKTPQGAQWLTVPVLDKGYRDMKIKGMRINNSIPWQKKHWRSIEQNYSKARYFKQYAPFLRDVYERQWERLAELDEYLLCWLLAQLDIDVNFLWASDYSFQGHKSGLVLDMCRQLGADTYIFGALGKDYAEVEKFETAGIKVEFQDYKHPVYPQMYGEFLPYMSVVDLLMNCGEDSKKIIMGEE